MRFHWWKDIFILYCQVQFSFKRTPYALVALYAAFIDAESILPLFGTLPAMFAKSSQLWTSLLYIITNKQIREKVLIFLPKKVGPIELSLSRSKTSYSMTPQVSRQDAWADLTKYNLDQTVDPVPRSAIPGQADVHLNQAELDQNSVLNPHNINRRMSAMDTQIAAGME